MYDAESDRILFGKQPWHLERYRHLDDNGLAGAFLSLMQQQGMTVRKLDILRYRESPQRLKYLADTQHVLVLPGELDDEWYLRDIGSFIGFLQDGGKAVVVQRKGSGYVYYDPSEWSGSRITPAGAGMLSKEGVFLYEIPDQTKHSAARLLLKSLWKQKQED